MSGVPPSPLTNAITVVAGAEWQVGQHRFDQHLRDLPSAGQWHALTAGLAVDADAKLHLVLAQLEGGLAGRRDGA